MIRFACPGCQATFSVEDAKAGKTGKCPKCATQFVIPEADPSAPPPLPGTTAPPPLPDPPAPSADAGVEIKPCPGCQGKLTVAATDIGSDVECPYCKTVFRAKRLVSNAPAPPPAPPKRSELESTDETGRPKRRRDDDEDDDRPRRRSRRDEDDEYDDRPRRRRSNRRADAEAAVAAPGIALMILGGVGFIVAIASLFFNFMELGNQAKNPQRMGGAAEAGTYVGMFLPFLWAAIVGFSGYKLKTLSGWGSALVGCIFAILPCSACCLLGIPFGIWGIVVLMKPEVKESFQ